MGLLGGKLKHLVSSPNSVVADTAPTKKRSSLAQRLQKTFSNNNSNSSSSGHRRSSSTTEETVDSHDDDYQHDNSVMKNNNLIHAKERSDKEDIWNGDASTDSFSSDCSDRGSEEEDLVPTGTLSQVVDVDDFFLMQNAQKKKQEVIESSPTTTACLEEEHPVDGNANPPLQPQDTPRHPKQVRRRKTQETLPNRPSTNYYGQRHDRLPKQQESIVEAEVDVDAYCEAQKQQQEQLSNHSTNNNVNDVPYPDKVLAELELLSMSPPTCPERSPSPTLVEDEDEDEDDNDDSAPPLPHYWSHTLRYHFRQSPRFTLRRWKRLVMTRGDWAEWRFQRAATLDHHDCLAHQCAALRHMRCYSRIYGKPFRRSFFPLKEASSSQVMFSVIHESTFLEAAYYYDGTVTDDDDEDDPSSSCSEDSDNDDDDDDDDDSYASDAEAKENLFQVELLSDSEEESCCSEDNDEEVQVHQEEQQDPSEEQDKQLDLTDTDVYLEGDDDDEMEESAHKLLTTDHSDSDIYIEDDNGDDFDGLLAMTSTMTPNQHNSMMMMMGDHSDSDVYIEDDIDLVVTKRRDSAAPFANQASVNADCDTYDDQEEERRLLETLRHLESPHYRSGSRKRLAVIPPPPSPLLEDSTPSKTVGGNTSCDPPGDCPLDDYDAYEYDSEDDDDEYDDYNRGRRAEC